jgi:hypothetical protein
MEQALHDAERALRRGVCIELIDGTLPSDAIDTLVRQPSTAMARM